MSPRGQFVVVTLGAVVMCAATARLGFWQLERGAQKAALRAAIDARAKLPPLAALEGDAAALQHRRITLAGRWSAAHTVYLDNRQMDGRPGFYVVTPLVLADGRAVLVQRGWVARDLNQRTRLPALTTPADVLRIEGRIAPPPARLYDFAGGEAGRIRQNLDLDAFARETGLRLVPGLSVLQTDAPSAADAPLRRDWPAPGSGVAKHHGYAFQWFGLSALVAALYVWFQVIQPRRRRRA
ncbi:MAG TPA: SURF1 family protein [Burkholderiaceae bacterium]|nr:SURF1 family protein [Burkholderiaceae bacterium]